MEILLSVLTFNSDLQTIAHAKKMRRKRGRKIKRNRRRRKEVEEKEKK